MIACHGSLDTEAGGNMINLEKLKLVLDGYKKYLAGILLYAKTDEAVTPDCMFRMGGNLIGAKTLDLNVDFKVIASQLDKLASDFFGMQAT